jgi:hypothetical protein
MILGAHRVSLLVAVSCGLCALAATLVMALSPHEPESLTTGGDAHLYYVRGDVTEVEPDANALSVHVTSGNDDGYFAEDPVRFVFERGYMDVSGFEVGQEVMVGYFRQYSTEGNREAYLVRPIDDDDADRA